MSATLTGLPNPASTVVYDEGGFGFNVKAIPYGATGNGVTDDTAAIHRARDAAGAGGLVLFPAGTYLVNALIANAAGQTWWLADGATLLLAANATVSVLSVAANNFTIIGGKVDGNKANISSAASFGGIVNFSVAGTRIKGVHVTNTYQRGIYDSLGSDLEIQGCIIDNTGHTNTSDTTGAGIYLSGTTRARIIGNSLNTIADSGIVTQSNSGASKLVIADNIVRTCFFIGIGLGGGAANTKDCTITGNLVDSCTCNGIDTGNAQYVTVTGNTVKSCNAGIVNDPTGGGSDDLFLTVSGNIIDGTTNALGSGYGIGLTGSCAIAGNHVSNCANGGIVVIGGGAVVATSGGVSITGNVVRNSALLAGITLASNNASFPLNKVTIAGNTCYDDQAVPTQPYGVKLTAASNNGIDQVVITGNNLLGNVTAGLTLAGGAGTGPTTYRVSGNLGAADAP